MVVLSIAHKLIIPCVCKKVSTGKHFVIFRQNHKKWPWPLEIACIGIYYKMVILSTVQKFSTKN